MPDYRVLPAGDTALVVEFGDQIDRRISAFVLALAQRLDDAQLPGVVETVPTFRSLMVHYEPLVLPAAALTAQIANLMQNLRPAAHGGRLWRLPACYDDSLAPDLTDVAARTSLSPAQIVERHAGVTYHVYMLGFLPGQAYMGDLPEELVLARRETPRPKIPAGSLAIAMGMTSIFPMETPCGWNLIGRSPVVLWRGEAGALLAPGDQVTFAPVSLREYEDLAAKAAAGLLAIDPVDRHLLGAARMTLRILSPGPMTTIQDLGRHGHQRLGIPVGGALDPVSLRAANALAGNAPGAGVIEAMYVGPTFAVEAETARLAFVGANATIEILPDETATEGRRIATQQSVLAKRGEVVRIGSISGAATLYIAIEGGFELPALLGSVATDMRGRLGGYEGRALAAGDQLRLRHDAAGERGEVRLEDFALPHPERIRVIVGPQSDYFSEATLQRFFESEYMIGAGSNRMGMRLEGVPLDHVRGFNIVSDAIAPGSIQIPGNGQPIVLLADRQTTGGYPKIATVISADLPALGRLPIGSKIGFEAVTVEAAEAARRKLFAEIDAIAGKIVPLRRTGGDLARMLLDQNLISGVFDAAA